MKKLTLLTILIIASFSVIAQISTGLTREEYLRKAKNQKTAGKIVLAAGGAMAMTGILIAVSNLDFSTTRTDDNTGNAADIIGYSGVTVMAASIPLFMASSKNKKKALSISFKNQTIPYIQSGLLIYKTIPSLSIKISL